jgi:rhomboid protease GluP
MPLIALFHSQTINQAMNMTGQVVEHDDRYYLLVEEDTAPLAYQQLQSYLRENTPEESLSRPLHRFSKGYIGAYMYGLILLIVGALKSTQSLGLDWYHHGVAHSEKILDGEWWRTITALSLHGDIAHLAGNLGFGALFGLLVAQHIGSSAAWLMILLSGAAGNYLNAYLHISLHLSIGASTMVFAALGILGVFALNDRYSYAQRGIRRWLPFIATLALLAFTGTAGENTDVIAHLAGYFCGCIAAASWIFFTRNQTDKIDQSIQKVMFFASFSIFVGAWLLAFH